MHNLSLGVKYLSIKSHGLCKEYVGEGNSGGHFGILPIKQPSFFMFVSHIMLVGCYTSLVSVVIVPNILLILIITIFIVVFLHFLLYFLSVGMA